MTAETSPPATLQGPDVLAAATHLVIFMADHGALPEGQTTTVRIWDVWGRVDTNEAGAAVSITYQVPRSTREQLAHRTDKAGMYGFALVTPTEVLLAQNLGPLEAGELITFPHPLQITRGFVGAEDPVEAPVAVEHQA